MLERVPLSVVLRRTGSNLSSQARVSGDTTPSPTTDSEDANLFTPRWPTLRRSLAFFGKTPAPSCLECGHNSVDALILTSCVVVVA